MAHSDNSGLTPRIFLKFHTMKEPNRYMKILVVFFERKIHLRQFDLFRPFFTVWLDMVEIEPGHWYYCILKLSRHISFMIITGYLNSQDMIRILKQSDTISLVNIYVVDIVWILCDVYMWRPKFNRGWYDFVRLL